MCEFFLLNQQRASVMTSCTSWTEINMAATQLFLAVPVIDNNGILYGYAVGDYSAENVAVPGQAVMEGEKKNLPKSTQTSGVGETQDKIETIAERTDGQIISSAVPGKGGKKNAVNTSATVAKNSAGSTMAKGSAVGERKVSKEKVTLETLVQELHMCLPENQRSMGRVSKKKTIRKAIQHIRGLQNLFSNEIC